MLSRAAKISAVLLGFLVSQASAGAPEEEVLVLTRPGVIAMPEGRIQAALDEIRAPQKLLDAFHAIQAQAVRKAMPDFNPADTAGIGPYGNIATLPDFGNLFALRLPIGADRDSAVLLLQELPQVIYAEKNGALILRATFPNDDIFPKQWNLDNTQQSGGNLDADIDAPEAWDLSKGSSSVRLGIIDRGVDKTHEDLSSKVLGDDGYDSDHGTAVAGIAAAITDNNHTGIAGVDWYAQIWAERISDDAGVTAQAIYDAVDNGSKVINCSWGWSGFSQTIYSAFVYAYTHGVLPVVALTYEGQPEYPDIFGLWNLMVSASNDKDRPAGGNVPAKRYTDIAAPAITIRRTGDNVDLITTVPGNKYWNYQPGGTSFAAPQATGVAGLLLAANPELRNYDLEWMIKLSAEDKGDAGWDEYFGYGRLNALEAVRLAKPPYSMTRGTPALTLVRRTWVDFQHPPCPDEESDRYLCDVYKLEASTTHPYGDPLGWFSLTGYSPATINNSCREYVERLVAGSSITLRTYFYWLVCDDGFNPVNKWAPVDPELIPLKYTLLGLPPNWTELAPLPAPPSGKPIKDGGCMAYDAGTDLIFASKGNKTLTGDFYAYNVNTGTWATKTGIPLGAEGKAPYKGSVMCSDGNGTMYLTKGNNTLGFWKYDATSNAWTQLANVPEGSKKVKQGASLAWATSHGVGAVYLLKGYLNEFYKYMPATDEWVELDHAPTGTGNFVKWDAGSWLVYNGLGRLYAHQAKYHKFYYFDTESEQWVADAYLTAMPIGGGGSNKKAKDGSCAALYSGKIYAFKGGNTTEFWRYDWLIDQWRNQDDIPLIGMTGARKKVKAGAALAARPGAGIYAFKGNKSLEYWRFVPVQNLASAAVSRDGSGAAAGGPALGGEEALADGLEASKPRWNWQGTSVCYSKTDTLTNREQIYQCSYPMSLIEQRVVDLDEDCEEPVYSPDGQYIAFQLDDTVSDFYQLCVTTASDTGPVLQVTFAGADHCYPEWSLDGQWLCYERDDGNGYTQVWRVPAFGGTEQQLTFGNSDHYLPEYLNAADIVFTLSPDTSYDKIAKVNVTTLNVTVLSSFDTDHDKPSAAWDGSDVAAEALDDLGNSQVVRMMGPAGETWLTSGNGDIMEPDYGQDNQTIFAVRWTGITSQIVWVDAANGGYTAVTDSLAIRDNPDARVDTVLSTALSVYEREAWSPENLLLGGGGRRKHGSGVYLSKFRKPHPYEGSQGTSIGILALDKAKPNPASGRVTIRWQVPVEAGVSLCVYNTAGQLVKVLADGKCKPGAYTSVWNGTDAKGRRLANGVYFYALDNGTKRISKKVVLTE